MSSTDQGPGVVVVTGASKGVGYATVRSLAMDHGRVVLAVSRDAQGLADLAEQCRQGPGDVEPLAVDLLDPASVRSVVEQLAGRRLVALVHNAGAMLNAPVGTLGNGAVEDLFRVNVVMPLMLTQALIGHLQGDPPSHVVHIGSMGGFQDSAKFPGLSAYSASKAALACLAQCLAVELADKGIRSNCLALGAVDTAMLREAFPGYTAPIAASEMGAYVARFALEGHRLFNGKVLPVAVSTP